MTDDTTDGTDDGALEPSDPFAGLFDALGEGGLGGLLEQAQAAMAAQVQNAEVELVGRDPNGHVQIRVTGMGEFLDVVIDPAVVDPADVETLEDLVVLALRDCNLQIANLQAQSLGLGSMFDLTAGDADEEDDDEEDEDD
jgi:DNA-binding protein YbaB